ncbi:hypothetical protein HDU80_000719 [Chytriomyces hyalinus]|nr:hypothetical protein HDU80_000719 [Chytriomyces hyalinus]
MPLTKEQSNRVRHEVDHAGLVNRVICKDRIAALSTEFQCDIATVKNAINNHWQNKRKSAAKEHAVPAIEPEPTCDQQPKENLSLRELNEILIQKPRKLRLVVSEKTTGYQMFLRKLGKELEDANKELKKEDSQAELLKMSEFQMVTTDAGAQVGSKWAALHPEEREEYERMARSQMLASKENVDLAGGSAEIQEVQRKAYSIMMAGIRNFGGTHIGASRLPYESDDNCRIVTVASGDFAEETVKQTEKAAMQHQTKKVLTFLDLRQKMEQNEDSQKIIACPKKVVAGVQKRRMTFQADLLQKYQMFKPSAKKVPLKELREGKVHGVQMINWPNAVTRCTNFNEKDLEVLERNPVSLVKSADNCDHFDDSTTGMPVDENAEQESTHTEDQRNLSEEWMGSHMAASEMQVFDAAMISSASFNSVHLDIPASNGVEQVQQSIMDLSGMDLDALSTLLGLPYNGI